MKISIAFTEAERERAAAVVRAIQNLCRVKVKETPPKDEMYFHFYLRTLQGKWSDV